MNIVVLTYSGKTITRPSTTLEKNGHDLYLPDFIDKISVSPALIINVSRPGRAISQKFAPRYADSLTFGCLIYPENLIDGSPEGFACANCLDHTTHIGSEKFALQSSDYNLIADGSQIAAAEGFDPDIVSNAIAEVSKYVFIRTGDIIAVELAARRDIAFSCDKDSDVQANFAGKKVLDFKVIG